MQFKVPQSIDMEDKIVGPLTLVQFTELTVAGMIFYLTLRFTNLLIVIFIGAPILLFGLALAFVKIQDQPFSTFVAATIGYLGRPKLRVWKKDPTLERIAVPAVINPLHQAQVAASVQARSDRRQATRGQLDQLARLLDTQGETAVEAVGGVTAKGIGAKLDAGRPKDLPIEASRT